MSNTPVPPEPKFKIGQTVYIIDYDADQNDVYLTPIYKCEVIKLTADYDVYTNTYAVRYRVTAVGNWPNKWIAENDLYASEHEALLAAKKHCLEIFENEKANYFQAVLEMNERISTLEGGAK